MSLALSVLPLVLIIACGYGLARSGILPAADWKGIEILSFRVLIPAVLVLAIMRTDLSEGGFGTVVLALLLSWGGLCLAALGLRLLPQHRMDDPAFTTVFQAGTRWNAFVALAAADQFAGDAALAVLAVAIALLIPVINISCIVVLSAFGSQRTSAAGVLRTVALNPMVQACAAGLALYLGGVSLPRPLIEALEMVGDGALGVGLLAVGAGISLRRLGRWNARLGIALALRPVLAPCLFVAIATGFGLTPVQTIAGVLVFASPAAANGYIIARQMGGDPELYADAMTWQTLLCLAVLPAWAYLLLN